MLLRHLEIPHELQRSLDKIYVKIKQMSQLPNTNFELDFGEEDELDILFEPEFDLDAPEDKDDS
jgi:hypothetical protein